MIANQWLLEVTNKDSKDWTRVCTIPYNKLKFEDTIHPNKKVNVEIILDSDNQSTISKINHAKQKLRLTMWDINFNSELPEGTHTTYVINSWNFTDNYWKIKSLKDGVRDESGVLDSQTIIDFLESVE
ncbi:hypothetical protein GFV16_00145 [Bacillus megaterium]|uniref:hypothetical protein n=1 Tax=Priestia megaterium TaxID=1404 RepID=UPI00129343D9|nr:hypothetical protein [Priestia megaterium]MQR84354.1 hypothetical protein [Priestia megaterium]